MLAIIECLLKFGANPNLRAKNRMALIARLFVPCSCDGHVVHLVRIRLSRGIIIKLRIL